MRHRPALRKLLLYVCSTRGLESLRMARHRGGRVFWKGRRKGGGAGMGCPACTRSPGRRNHGKKRVGVRVWEF